MNVSRPSLQRELRKLEEAGIITYTPPMVTIIDADALQDVLSQYKKLPATGYVLVAGSGFILLFFTG